MAKVECKREEMCQLLVWLVHEKMALHKSLQVTASPVHAYFLELTFNQKAVISVRKTVFPAQSDFLKGGTVCSADFLVLLLDSLNYHESQPELI